MPRSKGGRLLLQPLQRHGALLSLLSLLFPMPSRGSSPRAPVLLRDPVLLHPGLADGPVRAGGAQRKGHCRIVQALSEAVPPPEAALSSSSAYSKFH